jgi:predicted Zn-dependent peptidase
VPGHELTVLPSGLRVVTERLEGRRSVSLGLWVRAGSRDEDGPQGGISHFIEHLLFRGSSHFGALEIAQVFDTFGGELNAETGKESMLLACRVLDVHLRRALEVMADMLQRPAWADTEAEREVLLEEIAMIEDTPGDLVHDLAAEALFGAEHPLGRPIIGRRSTVAALGPQEFATYHADRYRAGNIVVSAAGCVDHDDVVGMCTKLLGEVPSGRSPDPAHHRVERTRLRAVGKDIEQCHLCLSAPGLARGDERRFAASVLDTILGGSASSRLFQEIRERRGMAYSVYSYGSSYHETGEAGVYVGTRPENVPECLDVVRDQASALAAGELERGELERAREHLEGRILLGLESAGARMSRLGRSLLGDTEILTPEEIAARVHAVTAADVAALAADLLDPDRLSAAAITPEPDRFVAAVERTFPGLARRAA